VYPPPAPLDTAGLDRTDSTRDRIIDSQLGGMPYASLDVFIIPPQKLLQKAERRRKQAISTT